MTPLKPEFNLTTPVDRKRSSSSRSRDFVYEFPNKKELKKIIKQVKKFPDNNYRQKPNMLRTRHK